MKRAENEAKHYQTFEDLEVYQVAREFRKAIYRLAKELPGEEIRVNKPGPPSGGFSNE